MPNPASPPRSSLTLPAVGRMIRWPFILTFVVLSVRLIGEWLGWDPRFFSREGGPSLSAIGIVWLIPVIGFVHGFVIAGRGHAPDRPGLAMTLHVLGALATVGAMLLSARELDWPMTPIGLLIGTLVTLAFAWRAWPELLRYSLAYAFLARLAVVALTIPAVMLDWHTHLDAVSADVTLASRTDRLGFLCAIQLLGWVPLTVAACGFFGSLAALLRGRRADDAIDD